MDTLYPVGMPCVVYGIETHITESVFNPLDGDHHNYRVAHWSPYFWHTEIIPIEKTARAEKSEDKMNTPILDHTERESLEGINDTFKKIRDRLSNSLAELKRLPFSQYTDTTELELEAIGFCVSCLDDGIFNTLHILEEFAPKSTIDPSLTTPLSIEALQDKTIKELRLLKAELLTLAMEDGIKRKAQVIASILGKTDYTDYRSRDIYEGEGLRIYGFVDGVTIELLQNVQKPPAVYCDFDDMHWTDKTVVPGEWFNTIETLYNEANNIKSDRINANIEKERRNLINEMVAKPATEAETELPF